MLSSERSVRAGKTFSGCSNSPRSPRLGRPRLRGPGARRRLSCRSEGSSKGIDGADPSREKRSKAFEGWGVDCTAISVRERRWRVGVLRLATVSSADGISAGPSILSSSSTGHANSSLEIASTSARPPFVLTSSDLTLQARSGLASSVPCSCLIPLSALTCACSTKAC
ncbi:hypothetical protein BCR35DRAFT_306666 [Leucosporidium creatinivorum]|uniref:Uncharacterized protein n=1 Tax=Leucosporidium creatinivorum TaxID=106004 RepID=A0A1Y2ESL5_9BASI|nr:hypothetical protein BCR35DRAFT_306666 [Leucosporidium creatinivorum]